jgi:hypothetical protein
MAILLLWPGVASAAAPDVALDIRLHSGTTLEQRGREQLIEIVKTHNLEKWLFTRAVVIQSRVIPHSHLVLTLNTRHLDDNVAQLATLLHEQLHWFITDHVSKAATEAAMQELRRLFPHVPTEPPMGARGERSTYLHLIICYLELEALSELLGVETARTKLATWDYYTWVYATVLTDTGADSRDSRPPHRPCAQEGSAMTRPNSALLTDAYLTALRASSGAAKRER